MGILWTRPATPAMLPAKAARAPLRPLSASPTSRGTNPPDPAAWAAPKVFPDTDECFFLHCFQTSFAVSSRSSRKTDALGAALAERPLAGAGGAGGVRRPTPKYPGRNTPGWLSERKKSYYSCLYYYSFTLSWGKVWGVLRAGCVKAPLLLLHSRGTSGCQHS